MGLHSQLHFIRFLISFTQLLLKPQLSSVAESHQLKKQSSLKELKITLER
jgi:hypothetical protein